LASPLDPRESGEKASKRGKVGGDVQLSENSAADSRTSPENIAGGANHGGANDIAATAVDLPIPLPLPMNDDDDDVDSWTSPAWNLHSNVILPVFRPRPSCRPASPLAPVPGLPQPRSPTSSGPSPSLARTLPKTLPKILHQAGADKVADVANEGAKGDFDSPALFYDGSWSRLWSLRLLNIGTRP